MTKVSPRDVVVRTDAFSDKIVSPFSLKLTRGIDQNFKKIDVQLPKYGYNDLPSQLRNLGLYYEHTLLDDIVFSGQDCKELIETAKIMDVFFKKVIAGVVFGQGKEILNKLGVVVESLYNFSDILNESYVRHFLPGFPESGKTLVSNDGSYFHVPYLLPWGNPVVWASVPKKNALKFSIACIKTTIEFWEEVHPSVGFFEVPAVIFDPSVKSNSLRFVDYLYECKKRLT